MSPYPYSLISIPLSLSFLIPLTSLRTTLSSIPNFTSLPSHYSLFSSFAHIIPHPLVYMHNAHLPSHPSFFSTLMPLQCHPSPHLSRLIDLYLYPSFYKAPLSPLSFSSPSHRSSPSPLMALSCRPSLLAHSSFPISLIIHIQSSLSVLRFDYYFSCYDDPWILGKIRMANFPNPTGGFSKSAWWIW